MNRVVAIAARLRNRPLLRSVGGILLAGAANNAVSFVMTVMAARWLDPSGFAVLGIMLAVMMFGSTVLDTGASVSLVRLYQLEKSDGGRLIRSVLGWKFLMGACAAILAIPFASIGRAAFFGDLGASTADFVWAVAGAGLMTVWMTIRSAFQAHEDFRFLSLLTYLYALVRVVILTVALYTNATSATDFFAAIYVMPLIVILPIGTIALLRGRCEPLVRGRTGALPIRAWRHIRSVFLYGRWVALSSVAYALLWRLPQFTLSHRADPDEVGYYSAGFTFIAFFFLLNDSIRTVILPRVAGMRTAVERASFRSSIRRWGCLYFAGMIAMTVVLTGVQLLALGEKYARGVPIFLVLSVGTIVTLYSGLHNSLVHSHGLPHLDAGMNVLKVLLLAGILIVVPPNGVIVAGAFAVVLVSGEWGLTAILAREEMGAIDS